MAEGDRRVELVDKTSDSREAGRVGVGLMIGLFTGHRALLAAATGRSAFETSLGSFVLIVLVSVGGVLFLGRLYDRFDTEAAQAEADDAAADAYGGPDEGVDGDLTDHLDDDSRDLA